MLSHDRFFSEDEGPLGETMNDTNRLHEKMGNNLQNKKEIIMRKLT